MSVALSMYFLCYVITIVSVSSLLPAFMDSYTIRVERYLSLPLPAITLWVKESLLPLLPPSIIPVYAFLSGIIWLNKRNRDPEWFNTMTHIYGSFITLSLVLILGLCLYGFSQVFALSIEADYRLMCEAVCSSVEN